MNQYFTIELRKLLPYRTFWVFLILYMALMFLFMYSGSHVKLNNRAVGDTIYQFPEVWQNITYIASYFNLLLGILLITLISDEYAFRTIRQQVIDGLFRTEIIANKFGVALFIGIISTIFLLGLGLGFGTIHTPVLNTEKVLTGSLHLVYYLVQALGYMSIAVFFAFLLRKSGLAIICFLVYTKIAEPIIHWQTPDDLDKYFPMKVFSSLTPMPGKEVLESMTGPSIVLSPPEAILPAVSYLVLFYLLAYLIIKIRDL